MTRLLIVFIFSIFTSLAFAKSHHAGASEHSKKHETFTAEEKKEIGEIAAKYLVEHPQFLIEASKSLQAQQIKAQKQAFAKIVVGKGANGKKVPEQLLKDKETPYVGPAKAKVTVIEFFDYQCAFCSKVAPVMEKVVRNNPDVRFVFKDFPIFGSQWPTSDYAANVGVLAFKQGGSKLYNSYHNAVFNTGKDEGDLKIADINKIAKNLKIKLQKHKVADNFSDKIEQLASIKKNMSLGSDLKIMGTPFIVVMPTENASVDNVTVFAGYPVNPSKGVDKAVEAIQKAIDKASNPPASEDDSNKDSSDSNKDKKSTDSNDDEDSGSDD